MDIEWYVVARLRYDSVSAEIATRQFFTSIESARLEMEAHVKANPLSEEAETAKWLGHEVHNFEKPKFAILKVVEISK